jgi:hypothetical protein
LTTFTYTLLGDGPKDKVLCHVLTWLLREKMPDSVIRSHWANELLYEVKGFDVRIKMAVEKCPCDLLFIHRDAEREPFEARKQEIDAALDKVKLQKPLPIVCVIPVRMTEAWFLFDEMNIRRAAGNPNGKVTINLPSWQKIEDLPDPKDELNHLFREASGLKGRRLKDFHVSPCLYRLADIQEDFSPLRNLSAFRHFEESLDQAILSEE